VVQACIALEYPPDQDHALNVPRDAQNRIIGLVSERFPPIALTMYGHVLANGSWAYEGKTPGGTGLVHFDIDPQNSKSPSRFVTLAISSPATSSRWRTEPRPSRRQPCPSPRPPGGRLWPRTGNYQDRYYRS
jgi:hypothetical protein